MSLSRLKSVNPPANLDELLLQSNASYLVAVIASNLSESKESKITVWIDPFEYQPITSGEEEEYRAYVLKDLILPPAGSFETWRFAVGVEDKVFVKSNNGKVSFSLEAVAQSIPVTED
jgi:hypothetical protein